LEFAKPVNRTFALTKSAANFANEHESDIKKKIRVFRADSRLCFSDQRLSAKICGEPALADC